MLDNTIVEKGIFRNHLGIEQDGLFITPLRFTKKQLLEYQVNQARQIRSRCPSGICLDMITDSDFVRFEYTVKDFARAPLYFDIFLNDVLVKSIGYPQIEKKQYLFEYKVDKRQVNNKANRITIYLPCNAEIAMSNFELSDNASIDRVNPNQKTLLCLGDSITQGMDALHPSSTYPVLLSRFLEMNLINQGVGGYVFNSASLDEDIKLKPDIITVAYGTNDWSLCDSLAQFRSNCSGYMEKLVAIFPDTDIYVVTPFWRSDIDELRPSGSFFDIADTIKDVCRAYPEITVLDGLEMIPHLPDYFGDKKLHPSDEGFKYIALNLLKKAGLYKYI
jgi:hypothetical protein